MFSAVPGLSARAATDGDTGNIGYYVRAVLPENQIDDTLTYFDLHMAPGQSQVLEVEVVNETNEAITVDLAAISASTNRNGVIDYKTPDIRDKTLEHPFSELATPEASSLTIQANGTAIARVVIDMPGESYDGVVLGGMVFTRQPDGAQTAAEGTSVQNVYSYVLGVKLSETDTAVAPAFEIESIKGETVNYLPALVHNIRNTEAAIVKGMDLHITVKDAEGNTVAEVEKTGIDMAPNSVMPLAVTPEGSQLVPGDYTSEITLTHNGQSVDFTEKFTVGSVEAENINAVTPGGTETQPAMQIGATTVILLAIGAAVVVLLLIIVLLLVRRRKDQQEREREVRRKMVYQKNEK